MRLKRKRRDKHTKPAEWRPREGYALTIVAGILIAFVTVGVVIAVYQRTASTGIYRAEYEGRVIEKSETFTESNTGSLVRRRLLVEDRNGVRFEVAVSKELYDRVRKGMWIKKSRQGVELSWP